MVGLARQQADFLKETVFEDYALARVFPIAVVNNRCPCQVVKEGILCSPGRCMNFLHACKGVACNQRFHKVLFGIESLLGRKTKVVNVDEGRRWKQGLVGMGP